MVISHTSPAYRGNPPDYFTPPFEDEPARMGRTIRWCWSDEPVWNVQVCKECDFTRGIQCEHCEAKRALHRQQERQ